MSRDKEPLSPDVELADTGGKIRLFTQSPLTAGAVVEPSQGQAHYLLHVMRAKAGDHVRLFNGRDGEWRARLNAVTKRSLGFVCEASVAEQNAVPDLWLAFAPIKKTPADYVAQKAVELGVSRLMPVITRRTVARRVNTERLLANAIEAAEQSGRLSVPEISEPLDLEPFLEAWPVDRALLFCDEKGEAPAIAEALTQRNAALWGILTGPEGGFDPAERAAIRAKPFTVPVTLGPRIMRADTASLAALSVWQALCGDWRL